MPNTRAEHLGESTSELGVTQPGQSAKNFGRIILRTRQQLCYGDIADAVNGNIDLAVPKAGSACVLHPLGGTRPSNDIADCVHNLCAKNIHRFFIEDPMCVVTKEVDAIR